MTERETQERDKIALDWVRVHCEPVMAGVRVTNDWVWPSGYRHTETESVKIARMCQTLGFEPSDLVSSELFDALVNRVIAIEERLSDVEDKANE